LAVVVTVAKGYDLGYIWKTQGLASAGRTPGGYYINAAQAGERPGRGPGGRAGAGPVRRSGPGGDVVAAGHQPGRRSAGSHSQSDRADHPDRSGWEVAGVGYREPARGPGALQGVGATAVECELTREFGVAWVPRADGRGNEIRGVTRAQLDAYSTRTMQVHEKERELAQAWERRHGRAPTSRELLYSADDATLRSRQGKDAARVDWDALAARWDATLGGQLAVIAATVSDARGPGATAPAAVDGWGPAGPLSREAQARAVAKALALVSEKQPAWTRYDLVKQLALVMPAGKPGYQGPASMVSPRNGHRAPWRT
jgi:hypothetical protein